MRGHAEFYHLELVLLGIGAWMWMQGNDLGIWMLGLGAVLYATWHGFV